ncbi:YOP1 [Symbiodinium natans]|uniref:YOP1 protein n=1 Tax=Symbiodinium natans TaxID=878477 RepID=A0A812QRR2_9DINO|nr:YOP1 [Symbiodinium natans]
MFGFILSPIEFLLMAAYAPLLSLRALESKTLNDDTNLLAFWMVMAVLSAVESITWGAVWILPFYTELRFGLVVYMLFFQGGKKVYTIAIDPMYQQAKKKLPAELLQELDEDPKKFLLSMGQTGKEMIMQLVEKAKAKSAEASAPAKEKKKAAKAK